MFHESSNEFCEEEYVSPYGVLERKADVKKLVSPTESLLSILLPPPPPPHYSMQRQIFNQRVMEIDMIVHRGHN